MAGSESHGPARARADLFDGCTWFLAPLPATAPTHYAAVERFVSQVGATPVRIDADEHDRLLALVSHLPHALANLLVHQVGASHAGDHDPPLTLAGPSFRDMTRIADANARVWTDIFLDNAQAVVAALAEHRGHVEQLESVLQEADEEGLVRWIEEAARLRA
jgi:prephenate dehydrogenase